MNVIPLTLIVSLGLGGLFIALFAWELGRRRFSSAESESLLPLAEERPRVAREGRTNRVSEVRPFGTRVPEPKRHNST